MLYILTLTIRGHTMFTSTTSSDAQCRKPSANYGRSHLLLRK